MANFRLWSSQISIKIIKCRKYEITLWEDCKANKFKIRSNYFSLLSDWWLFIHFKILQFYNLIAFLTCFENNWSQLNICTQFIKALRKNLTINLSIFYVISILQLFLNMYTQKKRNIWKLWKKIAFKENSVT